MASTAIPHLRNAADGRTPATPSIKIHNGAPGAEEEKPQSVSERAMANTEGECDYAKRSPPLEMGLS